MSERMWEPIEWQQDSENVKLRGPAVTIRKMVSPFYAGVRYAVRQGSHCLSLDGEWEFESLPSSRDDEFYDRCRFRTFGQACAAAERAKEQS
jgi:hypothetical protein